MDYQDETQEEKIQIDEIFEKTPERFIDLRMEDHII